MKYHKRYFTDTAKSAPPHSDIHQIFGMLRQFLYEKFPVLKQCRRRHNTFKLNIYWHPSLLSAMKYRKRYFTDTAKLPPPHSDMYQISGMLRQFLYEKFPVLKQCRRRHNTFKLNIYWHPSLLSAMKYRKRYFTDTAKLPPPHSDPR